MEKLATEASGKRVIRGRAKFQAAITYLAHSPSRSGSAGGLQNTRCSPARGATFRQGNRRFPVAMRLPLRTLQRKQAVVTFLPAIDAAAAAGITWSIES